MAFWHHEAATRPVGLLVLLIHGHNWMVCRHMLRYTVAVDDIATDASTGSVDSDNKVNVVY